MKNQKTLVSKNQTKNKHFDLFKNTQNNGLKSLNPSVNLAHGTGPLGPGPWVMGPGSWAHGVEPILGPHARMYICDKTYS